MPARPVPVRARLASLVAVLAVVLTGLLVPTRAWAAPATPGAPSLTTDGQSLTATWTAPDGVAVTGYVVRVLDSQGTQVATRRVEADTTSQTFSGLDQGSYTATVAAVTAEGAGSPSQASSPQSVTVDLIARWTLAGLASTAAGATVPDSSGNGQAATIVGGGASATSAPGGDGLDLPGGNGAYVKLPTGLVDGRGTLTVSSWLRNDTGSGNYAALFFGASAAPPSRYFLLNPKNPAGRFKSVLTTGTVSTGAPWGTETGISPTDGARGVAGPVTDNSWALYTTVITPTSITGYLNGAKVGAVPHTTSMATFGSGLVGYIGHSSYPDANYKGSVRDVRVYATALTDASVKALYDDDAVQRDRAALSLPATATTDLSLPTAGANGSQITWASSAPGVISTTGTVKRSGQADVTVTLTATVAGTGKQTTRSFEVVVPRDSAQDDVERVSAAFDLAIAKTAADLTLPTTVDGVAVAWSSSEPAVLANDGRVTRAAAERTVRLTATFSRGSASAVRTFDVGVLAADAGRIATYTQTGGTNRTDAVHLALSTQAAAGGSYAALNNGRPVLYAPTYDARLGAPTLFRRPDGSFGLLAVLGGSSGSASAWVWSSTDLVHFTTPRRIDLGRSTTAVRVAYDNAIAAYRLVFASDGTTYEVRTADFTTLSTPAATTAPAPVPATGAFPAGATSPSTTGVTAAELSGVQRAFTRMVNTGTRPVPDVSVAKGGVVDLPRSVTATYSNDGADTQLPVDWSAADLAAVDTSKPGTYTVHGTARATSYPATVGFQRADPDVTLADDGYYYLVGSYPQVGSDPEGYDRVNLRRSRTIAGLAEAPETTIWDEQNSALQRYVWAPELTKIGDTWYVLFTASRSANVFDIRPMMLRHTGGSLIDPANWVEVGAMLPKAGDRAFNSFSLDMTYFEQGGRHYVIWAQAAPSSALLLAEIDPANPRQLISDAVTIAYPDLAWEGNTATNQQIDEGPAVLQRDGKVYVSFSASTVDDKYSIGLLTADASADLLDAASWRKTPYPIMTTADLPAGQTGPGHNSFTTDELGNTVIVYHSRDTASTTDGGLTDPSRWAHARTVHFSADGSPVLNMTAEEELRPEHAAVSVQVVVTATPASAPAVPGTPVVSEVTDTTADVSWSASRGATGYTVTVRRGTDTLSTTTVTGTSTTLTGLTPGAEHSVSIEATNAAGASPAATSAAFTTTALPAPVRDFPLATDLTDRAGGAPATAVGATSFADGLTLPGATTSSTGYVRLPNGLLTGLGEDLTVSMWVKSDTPARNGAAASVTTPTQANGFPVGYWLLNPAGPNGNARSVMTSGAVNSAQPWTTEVQVAGPSTTSRRGTWVQYTTVFTAGTLTSYVDGVRVGSVAKTRGFADLAKDGALEAYLGRSGYSGDPAFKGSFRNLQVFGSALTPAQVRVLGRQDGFVLEGARERLTLGDTSAVQSDLVLPTTLNDNVRVAWSTSDPQVVTETGAVTVAGPSRSATLTATLTRGGRTLTKEFTVTVPGRDVVVARSAELLVAPTVLASGDRLPVVDVDGVSTTWTTTTPGLTVDGGAVSATARTTGTVTATLAADGVTAVTKTFPVTVLAAGQARFLLGYTRTPDQDVQVYGPNLAHSLHLALGAQRVGLTPLNHDDGVLFAKGVSTGPELTEIRTLVTPYLFRTASGGWGVVATRTTSGGTPDTSAATSALLFTSPDLVTWTEVGLLQLDASGAGVRTPRVDWDAAAKRYVVSWASASGTQRVAFSTDLSAVSAPANGAAIISAPQGSTTSTTAVVGNTVVLDTDAAKALTTRWGRVTNTTSSVAPVTLPFGGSTSGLTSAEAQLGYDDGSTATRSVTWNPADLAAVDTSRAGTYTVRGTVEQTDYAYPFIAGRADPTIIEWNGKQLFLATDRNEHRFDLRSADTIAGLATAADNQVLATSASLPGPLWAPEFHEIDGSLWVFFSAGKDSDCWCAVQSHVMKLTGTDPTKASSWSTPVMVTEKDGGRLQSSVGPGISLDMTYFTDTRAGTPVSYVVWSQRYNAGTLGDAQLWIATVDPTDPSKLTSDPVVVAAPDRGWDHNTSGVVEAPYVIRHGDRLVMTFSGSNIDNTYAIGEISAPAGADLLDPAVWTKGSAPRLTSRGVAGQFGPGHSQFATDEDGNTVLVYHARNGLGGSRDAGVRRIHWAADGSLVLDMTKDEEVAPANRQVTMTVTVQSAPVVVTPPVETTPTQPVTGTTPPVTTPTAPTAPTVPTTAPTVTVKGRAVAGRPVRLVISAPGQTTVTVIAAGKNRTVKVRDGVATVKLRWATPGKKKVVVKTATGKVVTVVRVRR